jgi:hypothetical protein
MTDFDFNTADPGQQGPLIPDGTILELQMDIKPGQAGDNGWLTEAKGGGSENLNVEFIVVTEGQYCKRKFKQRFTMSGKTAGHEEAGAISRNTLRAVLESARNINPHDQSESAKAMRRTSGWIDFNGLRFMARVAIEPASGGYAAKNKLGGIITPEMKEWRKSDQVQQASAPSVTTGVTTPDWAKDTTTPGWMK